MQQTTHKDNTLIIKKGNQTEQTQNGPSQKRGEKKQNRTIMIKSNESAKSNINKAKVWEVKTMEAVL